jgi:hypothetical protein
MPDKKISQDSLLTGSAADPATDYVPIVDPSEASPVNRNKRILLNELKIAIDLENVNNTSDSTKPVSTAQTAAILVAENNAKAYADTLVVGLWDDRGSFSAAGGAYPSSGGSGSAGAVKKGDVWTISVAGTLPTGQAVEIGDIVRALIDTPGNTQANWAIQQNNIGYTAENSANKENTTLDTSTTKYPTNRLVKEYADLRQLIINTEVALVDASSMALTAKKHTLSSSSATRTFTITYTGDSITLVVTLSAASATYTFPASALCVSEGVASGTNILALAGVSGDKYVIAIEKVGSAYYVVCKNFGQ